MSRHLSIAVPGRHAAALRRLLSALSAIDAATPGIAEPAADSGAPVVLAGPAATIRAAAYGLLVETVDELAEACLAYEDGSIPLARLLDAGDSAAGALELFARIEEIDRLGSAA